MLRAMNPHSRLLKKARCRAKILGRLPGVRAIFLSGSLAQGRASKNSDIDFFIITKAGQIWTARFFIFLVLKLLGQMRSTKNPAEKICPNHFITDQSLELQEKDAYAAHLFSHNISLYDPDEIWPRFVAANQKWVNEFGEEFNSPLSQTLPLTKKKVNSLQKLLENLLRKIQTWKIQKNSDYKTPGAKIVLEDYELRFHPTPKNLNFKR